ncbi:MAG: RsmE family RNA methyltransferase [Opitutales bacterium]|nr:RsmE family RNA methyltransferase [Opitutales bacterium]
MNLLLLPEACTSLTLPRSDPRFGHIYSVLKMRVGDTLDVGYINGARGKGTIAQLNEDSMELSFTWGETAEALSGLHAIIGLPRPQTARKLLQGLTTLGVGSMCFFLSDKGEPSYAESSLWTSDEWIRHLEEATAQAFSTHLPKISHAADLQEALKNAPACSVGLDNYEAEGSLATWENTGKAVGFVVGSERGFSAEERNVLRAHNIPLRHLGVRVLRTETAATTAASVLLAKTGYWD